MSDRNTNRDNLALKRVGKIRIVEYYFMKDQITFTNCEYGTDINSSVSPYNYAIVPCECVKLHKPTAVVFKVSSGDDCSEQCSNLHRILLETNRRKNLFFLQTDIR